MTQTIEITISTLQRLSALKHDNEESYDKIINRLIDESDERFSDEDITEINNGLRDIQSGRVYSEETLFKEFGLHS